MSTVVALGDSLTAGPGVPVGSLRPRSWAAWLAWALLAPLLDHAVPGATTTMVARDQVPLLDDGAHLAVTLLGANDVRLGLPFDEDAVAQVLRAARAYADLALVGTVPEALLPGISTAPGALDRLRASNAAVRRLADQEGVAVVVFDDLLRGPFEVGPDRLHPSARGQLLLARRAAVRLDELGVCLRRHLPEPEACTPDTHDRLVWPWARLVHDALHDRRRLLRGR